MEFETLFAKTPATLDEIRARVAFALQRHPLCRQCSSTSSPSPDPARQQLDSQPELGGTGRAVGGVRHRGRYPGRLRSRLCLISRVISDSCWIITSGEMWP